VLVLDYNDADAVRTAFDARGSEIAAVVVEPYACNMGLVLPVPGFLEELRASCDGTGALLIFDEVVTGFRFCYGSISNTVGVEPDLVTFGKIIGGGTPIGAYAGRGVHMSLLARANGVFQGGTFAGNPLSMAAGLAMLSELREPGFYDRLDLLGDVLEREIVAGLAESGLAYGLVRAGSAAALLLVDGAPPVRNHIEAARQDTALYGRLHLQLMRRGFLLPPSVDEVFFLSAAHTTEHVRGLGTATVEALAQLRQAAAPAVSP
jgi:glutamate-1-semialdehyde 2,1-aminomutase